MFSRKKEKNPENYFSQTWNYIFCVLSWNSVQSTALTPLQFPLREPIWHYHVFRMEASLQTANKLSRSTDSKVFTYYSHVRARFTSTRADFHRPSCVMLYFSSPNILTVPVGVFILLLLGFFVFFWWLNKKIWRDAADRGLTKTESHSESCGGKADPSHWVW